MNQDDRSSLSVPSRDTGAASSAPTNPQDDAQSQAAANILRGQIDSIYQNDPNATAPIADSQKPAATQKQPTTTPYNYEKPSGTIDSAAHAKTVAPGPGAVDVKLDDSPYNRTMNQDSPLETQDKSWQKYHTAWQSYYQQYYERYYISQVNAAKKSLKDQVEVHQTSAEKNAPSNDQSVTQDEAINDLRSNLRKRINQSAKKVRKSRHFMPIMAAALVMLVFLFLQYNRVLIAYVEAYVMPGEIDAESIIVSPTSEASVTADPKLIIPKIAVDVPIVWDANASSQASLNAAMDKGVAWFNIQGASAKPGEKGNFVVSGHSANDWTDGGNYKFIFARLEKINEGDIVYINYESKRYTYKITRTQVVKPTEVSALQIGADKPYITLITCTPLGTALNRLLVFGEQINPDPDKAENATKTDSQNSGTATQMPSNSPTFFERLFGGGN